ncbi:hypothetical protein MFIFM68171_08105 [Madurella fahalii]|uniref:CHAT domain-containing protein n=1 Tax=Madurella fahalii TaxID=1157608 RepID=A0ABQ0GK12_9PEZI
MTYMQPYYPNADPMVSEARRLRDLGDYRAALAAFDAIDGQPFVALEAAGMLLEQGLAGESLLRLHPLRASAYAPTLIDGPESCGLFPLLEGCAYAISTGKFSQAMPAVNHVYHRYLAPLSSGYFVNSHNIEPRMISTVLLYHELCALAKLVGYTPVPPVLPLAFFQNLITHLMQGARYDEARRVATQGRIWHQDLDASGVLRSILATPNISDIVYANACMSLADCIGEGGADAMSSYHATLKTANDFYLRSSHRFGPLLVQAKLLQKGLCQGTPDQWTDGLFDVESKLETYGAWNDITSCIRGIIELNEREFLGVDESLQVRLEHVLQSMRHEGCSPVVVVLLDLLRHMLWLKGGANVGRTLVSLEKLQEFISSKGMEVPALSFLVHQTLHDSYKKLGNIDKAAEVAAKQPGFIHPRAEAILGYDAFFRSVRKETESAVGGAMSDRTTLEADLWRVQQLMGSLHDSEDRSAQVQRLCNLCNLYLTQAEERRRDIDDTEGLIERILHDVDAYSAQLPQRSWATWAGHAKQIRARFQYLRNDRSIDNNQKQHHLNLAVALNNQAISMYDNEGLAFLSATARQQLAVCHKTLWLLHGDNSGSEDSDFSKAAALHMEAKDLLDRCGELASSRQNARLLLGVWVSAVTKGITRVRVRRWQDSAAQTSGSNTLSNLASSIFSRPVIANVLSRHRVVSQVLATLQPTQSHVSQPLIETLSPLEECVKGLAELDLIAAMDRDDVSALKDRRQAIAARQELNKAYGSREMFDVAFQVFDHRNDLRTLWHWVQKSKARSICDELGLGVNLPGYLKDSLAHDPAAQKMLQEEANLVAEIEEELGKVNWGNSIYLRQVLWSKRQEMRSNQVVSEVLDLREGQPLSLDRVCRLMEAIPEPETRRSTVFVDWVVINKYYCLIVLTGGELHHFRTHCTVHHTEQWKSNFQDRKRGASSGLIGTDLAYLRWLSPLVEPLEKLSQPGDLLVFSPSQDLFGIPLHAAVLNEDTNKVVIERNPVVYGHSTTTLCHSIAREVWGQRTPSTPHATVVVYEEDEKGRPWNDEQKEQGYDEILDMLDLNKQDNTRSLVYGDGIGKSDIESRLRSAAVLTFIGHGDDHPSGNKLLQGIRLSGHGGNPAPGAASVPSPRYTAADVLAMQFMPATSLVVLLACESAVESRDRLDEPTGLISALLCAGVSSVIGTMWKLRADTAARFASSLRRHLGEDMSRLAIIDLALAFQRSTLELKASEQGELPYHWASLALHGSWIMCRRCEL